MSFTDLQRKALKERFTFFLGDLTNVDNAGVQILTFVCPFTGTITGIQGGYLTEAGTAPQCDLNIRRGTTKIASVTATTAAVYARTKGLSAFVQEGETLNVFVDNTDAADDDDFTGLQVLVEGQILVDGP